MTTDTTHEEYRRAWEYWFSMIPRRSFAAPSREALTSAGSDQSRPAVLRRSTVLNTSEHGTHAEKRIGRAGMREMEVAITGVEQTPPGIWED